MIAVTWYRDGNWPRRINLGGARDRGGVIVLGETPVHPRGHQKPLDACVMC